MERKALQELAEYGLLRTSHALDAGWPPRTLTRALRAEGWVQLLHGIWAVPHVADDLLTRLRAMQLLEPRLVVSHRSAAALWRIDNLAPVSATPLEFIDPELAYRCKAKGVRVYRIPLSPSEVVERRGLRFTDTVRTLADLLRAGPRDQAIVAVESALTYRRIGTARRAPLTGISALASALQPPLKGAVRARHWLQLCDPRSGSPAETIARLRMYDAGLHPETQIELITPTGHRVILDFLFRREGLAVEIEGYAYHGTRDGHRRDVTRFNRLAQCPQVRHLLRFTAEDVFHHPTQMIDEIRATLSRG
ncbi:hypothetical protein AB0I00_40620 [Streptomyces sp. NPDC050803]|uniref:hypothetical protein n=1 Tax=unclassified Streptomyces TaxID=2593676 RepID=UPI00342485B1